MDGQKSSKLAGYAASESVSIQPEWRKIPLKGRFFEQGIISRAFSTKPTLRTQSKKFDATKFFIFLIRAQVGNLVTLAQFGEHRGSRF